MVPNTQRFEVRKSGAVKTGRSVGGKAARDPHTHLICWRDLGGESFRGQSALRQGIPLDATLKAPLSYDVAQI